MTAQPSPSRRVTLALEFGAPEERLKMVVEMVLDLLVEVEALRTAVIRLSGDDASQYRDAYRDAAFLSHNAAGPSSGREKILRLFYPGSAEPDAWGWRETLLLRRLGMSDADLEKYKKEAKGAELYT